MENKINSLEQFEALTEQVCKAMGWTSKLNYAGTKYFDLAGGDPNEENFWIWRELIHTYDRPEMRELFKANAPTVFAGEPWLNPLHFAHISASDNTMIAFTPDGVKGRNDVKVKMSVGKYLTKYYKEALAETVPAQDVEKFRVDMADKAKSVSGTLREIKDYSAVPDSEIRDILVAEIIKKWADKHREKVEEGTVLFASSREECAEVYLTGPSSCMDSAHKDTYMPNTGGVHPAEAYAGPDTVIAYTRRNGKINARTVCHIGVNPPRFTRIYGDTTLKSRLESLGFVSGYEVPNAKGLDGARLLRLPAPQEDQFIMPYLDSPAHMVRLNGPDYIMVRLDGGDGGADGQGQYGFVELEDDSDHEPCSCCGNHFKPSRMVEVHGGDRVCRGCIDNEYSWAYVSESRTEGYIPSVDAITIDRANYLETLDFSAMGLVELRDLVWTAKSNAVPHWAEGFIREANASQCGHRDGQAVYAGPAEVDEGWLLVGHLLGKELRAPSLVLDTDTDVQTIRGYIQELADARFASRVYPSNVLYHLMPGHHAFRQGLPNGLLAQIWGALEAEAATHEAVPAEDQIAA